MKRIGIILLIVGLAALSGCMWNQQPIDFTVDVERIDNPVLARPNVDGDDDWYVNALDRVLLDWTTRVDQYGHPVGLPPGWTLDSVSIQCELKTEQDTIYTPPYPYGDHGIVGELRPGVVIENACIWYPTFTGDIEGSTGLPFPPYPETNYPFDPCNPINQRYMPRQTATITATAVTDRIRVRLLCSEIDGYYAIDGDVEDGPEIERWVSPGVLTVEAVTLDGREEVQVLIPDEWFIVEADWEITVGPAGCQ